MPPFPRSRANWMDGYCSSPVSSRCVFEIRLDINKITRARSSNDDSAELIASLPRCPLSSRVCHAHARRFVYSLYALLSPDKQSRENSAGKLLSTFSAFLHFAFVVVKLLKLKKEKKCERVLIWERRRSSKAYDNANEQRFQAAIEIDRCFARILKNFHSNFVFRIKQYLVL